MPHSRALSPCSEVDIALRKTADDEPRDAIVVREAVDGFAGSMITSPRPAPPDGEPVATDVGMGTAKVRLGVCGRSPARHQMTVEALVYVRIPGLLSENPSL